MSISRLQGEFTFCCAKLIIYANSKGWYLTTGDGYRDPRVFGQFGEKKGYGKVNSVHKKRFAHDYNLFVDGEYITDGNHPAYKELGEYWKTVHPLARWGGDFKDANHFSFEFNGFK